MIYLLLDLLATFTFRIGTVFVLEISSYHTLFCG